MLALVIQAIAVALSLALAASVRERHSGLTRLAVALILVGQIVLFVLSALPYRPGARWFLAGVPILAGMALILIEILRPNRSRTE